MKKIIIFTIILSLFLTNKVFSATITANSCSQTDVQSAIDSAQDGDVVQIPAGTCTWTKTVKLGEVSAWTQPVTVSSKAITIQGAGIGQTVIIDGITRSANGNPPAHIFNLLTKEGGVTRITGMTLDGGSGTKDSYNHAMLQISGYSKLLRVDNIRFIATKSSAMNINGNVWGVVDHNVFDLMGWFFGIYVFHPSWGGKVYGDGSWAEPAYWGTEKGIYIEDNVFNSSTRSVALDGWAGGRAVFRYNTLSNTTLGTHGLDSGGRSRSMRSVEIYNNKINITDPSFYYFIGQLRGGSFLIHDNDIKSGFPGIFTVINYRDWDSYSPWGKCDGTSPFDLNDGVTYDTGSHTGTSGNKVLSSEGKDWEVNKWVGYSVHNTTKGVSDLIISNTKDTITTGHFAQFKKLSWDSGDSFSILRATICLDQRGRGAGDLISGSDPVPKTWSNQVLEPTYVWNNILNNSFNNTNVNSNSPRMLENRDFYITAHPDYTPYTYPHPLIISSSPLPPTLLPISPPPTSTALVGDLNLDHEINSLDFSLLNSVWFTNNTSSDLNKDGQVNSLDFAVLSSNWGRTW